MLLQCTHDGGRLQQLDVMVLPHLRAAQQWWARTEPPCQAAGRSELAAGAGTGWRRGCPAAAQRHARQVPPGWRHSTAIHNSAPRRASGVKTSSGAGCVAQNRPLRGIVGRCGVRSRQQRRRAGRGARRGAPPPARPAPRPPCLRLAALLPSSCTAQLRSAAADVSPTHAPRLVPPGVGVHAQQQVPRERGRHLRRLRVLAAGSTVASVQAGRRAQRKGALASQAACRPTASSRARAAGEHDAETPGRNAWQQRRCLQARFSSTGRRGRLAMAGGRSLPGSACPARSTPSTPLPQHPPASRLLTSPARRLLRREPS